MFGAAKPLASLSSGLLARKGQARPAMRPQGFAGVAGAAAGLEDLGWNDMGPAPEPAKPPVLIERELLRQEVAAPIVAAPEPVAIAEPATADRVIASEAAAAVPALIAQIGRDTARKGKAAFTLRLAADRHLRLRLASAVRHRSAQQLVSEALDAFLATLPEVEELARQCSSPDRLGD